MSVFTSGKTQDKEWAAQSPDKKGKITLLSYITRTRGRTDRCTMTILATY